MNETEGTWTLEPERPGFKFDPGSPRYKQFDLFEPQLPQKPNADANPSLRAFIIKCLTQCSLVVSAPAAATSASRDFA